LSDVFATQQKQWGEGSAFDDEKMFSEWSSYSPCFVKLAES